MTLTLEDKRELADGCRKIIVAQANNFKNTYFTIKSREQWLNSMWQIVLKYERENGIVR